MYCSNYPRIVIGGLAGDSGKTVISCGLLAYFKNRGVNVSGFKKGPDYIDAAWLSLVLDKPARNLDTFMMGVQKVKKSFLKNASTDGINIVEGNRGLFDGCDNNGTYSTAELAKLLHSPVIIIQDVTKVTRTAAAAVLGCKTLDPDLKIEGIILNRVAGSRHEKVAREAIEGITGIPVLGAIPKLPGRFILPSRYLGLITPIEFEQKAVFLSELENIIKNNVNVASLIEIARRATSINTEGLLDREEEEPNKQATVKIGYFKDKAFSFYYPENLEMLAEKGAELIPISSVHNSYFFDLDALYIGGGFPEINLAYLTSNRGMIAAVKQLAEEGLPIYAECGGLMYLAKEIVWKEKKYSLSGVLPVVIHMQDKPQGHGYCEMIVDSDNPYYETGTVIRGHEFHYSKVYDYDPGIRSALAVSRGCGCFQKRDGLVYKKVFASYVHVHATSTPEWVNGMMKCAKDYKYLKTSRLVGAH